MITTKIKIVLFCFLIGIVSENLVFAESPSVYRDMGRSSWSAFVCSALADMFDDTKEKERLFKHGYERGLEFVKAFRSEKVKIEHLQTGIPMIMLPALKGPNPDFILGRIYQKALTFALEEEFDEDGALDDEFRKEIARGKFWNQNCYLIGK